MEKDITKKPLAKFLLRRAKHRFGYGVLDIPEEERKAFEACVEKAKNYPVKAGEVTNFFGKYVIDGGKQDFESFLDEEGRGARRVIDIPDAAYGEGYAELLGFVSEIIDSRHKPSIQAALASMCQGPRLFPTPGAKVIPHFCHKRG